MKTNIIQKFSKTFSNAPEMWNKLSAEYNNIKERDAEMFDAFVALGDTVKQFAEASQMINKPDGISIQEALDILKKKKSNQPDEDYGFLLFVMMKNMEHAELVKMYNKPERIVKKAMTTHGKKRAKK